MKKFLLLTLVVGASGCAAATSSAVNQAGSPTARFRAAEELVFADSVEAQIPVSHVPPRFPPLERARGEEAGFVVALVLDTAGRAERHSVTFIGSAPPAFVHAVCTYYQAARYAPVHRDGTTRRALVVHPWDFSIEGVRLTRPQVDAAPVRAHLTHSGSAAATAELESLPHCP